MYLCCTHKHIVNYVCQQTDAKNVEFILKKNPQTIRADTWLSQTVLDTVAQMDISVSIYACG